MAFLSHYSAVFFWWQSLVKFFAILCIVPPFFCFVVVQTVYGNWWWNLVRNDPIHVLVETTLVVSILYILIARSKDWKETEEYLSTKEEEELLREWKLHGRAPLTPSSTSSTGSTSTTTTTSTNTTTGMNPLHKGSHNNNSNTTTTTTTNVQKNNTSNHNNNMGNTNQAISSRPLVVHKVHGPFMDISFERDNGDASMGNKDTSSSNSTTTTTASAVAPLSRSKFLSGGGVGNHNNNQKQNQQQIQQQQQHQQQQQQYHEHVVTVLNFANFDYLGMSSNQPSVRKAADQALNQYGCGACGPRGFYGTIDVHLQLEKEFAQFLDVDDAILYSDGASTCASTVAAFAKRGDLIVCDEAIYEPLRTGVSLSRAHLKWFKHNDMVDLRRVLTNIQVHDEKAQRKTNAQRRFLVVEGLYRTTGRIVPLQELVQLKHEFSYRLILDESNSFGTLGATGRGVHELFQCQLMKDVEITTIALENSMGAIGGITVGTEEVVDHQRLSGSGYCFSASLPPFTATAALQSLHLLRDCPQVTLYTLQDNISYLYYQLTQLCHEQLDDVLLVTSSSNSPILFLQVADIPETRDLEEVLFLQEVVQECLLLRHPITTTTTTMMTPVTTTTTSTTIATTTTTTTTTGTTTTPIPVTTATATGAGSSSSTLNGSAAITPVVNTTGANTTTTIAAAAGAALTNNNNSGSNNNNSSSSSSSSSSNHGTTTMTAATAATTTTTTPTGNPTCTTTTTTTTTMIHGMALVAVHSPPGIRITVSASHSHEQLDLCLSILTEAVEVVMNRSHV